jgi:hypothetical protein
MDDNEDQVEELLPTTVKWIGFLISAVISLAIILYIVGYAFNCFDRAPKDMGLSNLLLFTLACAVFFGIPWGKLGLSLKKFGPIEFERVLEGQSQERASDLSVIEDRLAELESKIISTPGLPSVPSNTDQGDMTEKVLGFMERYRRWSFSPKKMETWSDKNNEPEYTIFKEKPELLRRTLRKLVGSGDLDTRVSKKGNTLYVFNN